MAVVLPTPRKPVMMLVGMFRSGAAMRVIGREPSVAESVLRSNAVGQRGGELAQHEWMEVWSGVDTGAQ